MKKHPVDDLFKRKLEGMQRTPSENAWLKIQEKQPVRHRTVVWGWYAAAGVAAALMGGYLVWQNQQNALPGIHSEHSVAAVRPAPVDSAVSPAEKLNTPAEQLGVTEQTNHTVAPKETHLKPAPNAAQNAEQPVAKIQNTKSQPSPLQNTQPEPVDNAPTLAMSEKPTVPVNAIQPEPAHIPVTQGIKTLPDEPAVSRVNKPDAEPTRTIVVAVETGHEEVEEKPRNTRFARVFRQLKNARAGEKVDWDEVGFNPKSLVARVDDRLRNKDERSNEKDHLREKTKL